MRVPAPDAVVVGEVPKVPVPRTFELLVTVVKRPADWALAVTGIAKITTFTVTRRGRWIDFMMAIVGFEMKKEAVSARVLGVLIGLQGAVSY